MNVAIYVRVSKDEADSKGRLQDTENQLQPLLKYCEARGFTVKRVFTDRVSGGDSNRPAFKEMFNQYRLDAQTFNILDQATDQILPLEKFFQFAMRRTGQLKPSQNVAKAATTYFRTLEKKKALDALIPKIMIYTQALTPKKLTPRGLEFDQSLKKFITEWLNTKKGRPAKALIQPGGQIDVGVKALKAFVTMIDLGLNVPVGIAANIGETVATYTTLGKTRFALGVARGQTKKGKNILNKYKNFIGKSIWEEMAEPAKNFGDKFTDLIFGLFKSSTVRANKIMLLGSLTREEFKTGKI